MLFFPMMFLCCCIGCCCAFNNRNIQNQGPGLVICGICLLSFWIISITAWWIFAVIGMGVGFIPEANGAPTSDHLYL
jgi:hypothetical protein